MTTNVENKPTLRPPLSLSKPPGPRYTKGRQVNEDMNVTHTDYNSTEGNDSGKAINNESNIIKTGSNTPLLRPVRNRLGLPPPSTTFKTSGKSNESSEEPNKPETLIIPSAPMTTKEELTPRSKSGEASINIHGGSNNITKTAVPSGKRDFSPSQKSPAPNRNKVNVNPSKTALAIDKMKQEREERRKRFAEARVQKQQQQGEAFEVARYVEMINEIRSELDTKIVRSRRKSIGNCGTSAMGKDVSIQVCVRKRPLSGKESNSYAFDIATSSPSKHRNALSRIYVHEPKCRLDLTKTIETQWFDFDEVFDENSTNMQIYQVVGKPLVEKLFEGGNSTLFAYGQTGSGKTHTIFGSLGEQTSTLGVYEYVCKDLFRMMNDYNGGELTVSMCFFEIYGGKVFDLFGDRAAVNILEDGSGNVQVVGLNEVFVASLDEMLLCIDRGNQSRSTASTEANATSSRSHAIFQIILHKPDQSTLGKFSLIDLAGSERASESGSATKQSQFEGAEINKSLLALKECIRALSIYGDSKSGHVPFRASKLTQILRDALTGPRSSTVVIANISPSSHSCEHTLNTLRYAGRVKDLKSGTIAYNPSKKAVSTNKQYQGPETPTSISEEDVEEQTTLSSEETDSDSFSNVKEDELITPVSADATTASSIEDFPRNLSPLQKSGPRNDRSSHESGFKRSQSNEEQTPTAKASINIKVTPLFKQNTSPNSSPLVSLPRRVVKSPEQTQEVKIEKGNMQEVNVKAVTNLRSNKSIRNANNTSFSSKTSSGIMDSRNNLRKLGKETDDNSTTRALSVSLESSSPPIINNVELQESLDRLLKQQAYAIESVNKLSDRENRMFEEISRMEVTAITDYPGKLEDILTEKIAVLTAFKELVTGFKQKSRQAIAWENLKNAGLE